MSYKRRKGRNWNYYCIYRKTERIILRVCFSFITHYCFYFRILCHWNFIVLESITAIIFRIVPLLTPLPPKVSIKKNIHKKFDKGEVQNDLLLHAKVVHFYYCSEYNFLTKIMKILNDTPCHFILFFYWLNFFFSWGFNQSKGSTNNSYLGWNIT